MNQSQHRSPWRRTVALFALLSFLLLCAVALIAPALALIRAAGVLLDWNFYIGFIAGGQGELRRQAAGRFSRFGPCKAMEIVGVSAGLLLIVALGAALLELLPTTSH